MWSLSACEAKPVSTQVEPLSHEPVHARWIFRLKQPSFYRAKLNEARRLLATEPEEVKTDAKSIEASRKLWALNEANS